VPASSRCTGCRDEGRRGVAVDAAAEQHAGGQMAPARSTPETSFRFHTVGRLAAPGAAVTSRAPPSSSFLPCLVSNLRLSTRRTNGVVEAHRGDPALGGGAACTLSARRRDGVHRALFSGMPFDPFDQWKTP